VVYLIAREWGAPLPPLSLLSFAVCRRLSGARASSGVSGDDRFSRRATARRSRQRDGRPARVLGVTGVIVAPITGRLAMRSRRRASTCAALVIVAGAFRCSSRPDSLVRDLASAFFGPARLLRAGGQSPDATRPYPRPRPRRAHLINAIYWSATSSVARAAPRSAAQGVGKRGGWPAVLRHGRRFRRPGDAAAHRPSEKPLTTAPPLPNTTDTRTRLCLPSLALGSCTRDFATDTSLDLGLVEGPNGRSARSRPCRWRRR